MMFMVLILHDRWRVKYLSQFWSQSICLRIDVPLLLELFGCNAGSLCRSKEKRIKRFPDKMLEYETQTNVKWSQKSFLCNPEKKKEFKIEKKIYNSLNHTCPATLGP